MDLVDGDGCRQRVDVVVVRLLVFYDFCCESYMGPFTVVACFEETKAVAPGTVVRYRRAARCSARTVSSGAQVVQLRGPFDLVQMATRKSAFNAQISLQKCP